MPFRIPSESEGVHPLQAKVYPQDLSILASSQDGNGVLSGCAVSAIGGSQVAVASGVIVINGVRTVIGAQNVGIPLGTIMPRFDLIVAYSNGTVSDLWGQEAEAPIPRDVPTNGVVLASVFVIAMDKATEGYQITDKRVLVRAETAGTYNVLDYGAVGDGVTDDTVAIQATLDAAGKSGEVVFPPATYLVSDSLLLPQSAATAVMSFYRLRGYGAELLINQPVPIFKRMPATQPTNWAFISFIVEGLKFRGVSSGSLGIGIQIAATRSSAFRDCSFYNLARGIDGYFCLNTDVYHCHAEECSTYGFSFSSGSGVWTGGSTSNSSSNHTHFFGCYAIGKPGQLAQYRIWGANDVLLKQCAAEGGTPVYNVDYYHQDIGRNLVIENLHCENTPTGAHLRIVATRRVFVRGLHVSTSSGSSVIIDASGCANNATICVQEAPDPPIGYPFKHTSGSSPGGYRWRFEKFGISNTNPDMTQASNWWGGVVPSNLTIEA